MSTHIFEPITDRFGYGRYLDLEIVIDSETKYINASKLCKQNGKKLSEWLRYDSNKELVEAWSKLNRGGNSHPYYEIDRSDLIGINKTDQDKILGKYFHEDLFIMIAQWVNREFLFKVIVIVKNYNDRQNEMLIQKMKGQLKRKDTKIDEQQKKIDELIMYAKQNTTDIADMKGMMTDMRGDIRRMRSHLDNAIVSEDKREGIIVYRLDHDDEEVIRIRCGTTTHLNKFANKAGWHKEYTAISNAKRALNYLKDNDYITKQTESKYIMPDEGQRSKLLKMLRRVNASYKCT